MKMKNSSLFFFETTKKKKWKNCVFHCLFFIPHFIKSLSLFHLPLPLPLIFFFFCKYIKTLIEPIPVKKKRREKNISFFTYSIIYTSIWVILTFIKPQHICTLSVMTNSIFIVIILKYLHIYIHNLPVHEYIFYFNWLKKMRKWSIYPSSSFIIFHQFT